MLKSFRRKKAFSVMWALLLVTILVFPSGAAFAATDQKTWIDGNDPGVTGCTELKLDSDQLISGAYPEEDPVISVTFSEDLNSVSWDSTVVEVCYVFVKGGIDPSTNNSGGWLYQYSGATGDTDLVAGTNPNGGQQAISHVSFFYREKQTTPEKARISGYKFNDENGNGLWDTDLGEEGLSGWEIRLVEVGLTETTSETTVRAVYTDEDGSYSFEQLEPGTYRVYETQQTGWTQTYPVEDGEENFVYHQIVLDEGEDATGNNFGNRETIAETDPGSISGYKFNDINGNGVWDKDLNEEGLPGWEIRLVEVGLAARVAQTTVQTVYTAADGSYLFEELEPGAYHVYEIQQTGWTQTYPVGDGEENLDYHYVWLDEGENKTDKNFGNKETINQTGKGSISGYKFYDRNGNGAWDRENEEGLAGWTIKLFEGDPPANLSEAAPKAVYNTQSDGSYVFGDLSPGTYYVYEMPKSGWSQTYPVFIAEESFEYYAINLSEGQNVPEKNFGNRMDRRSNGGGGGGSSGGSGGGDPGGGTISLPPVISPPPEMDSGASLDKVDVAPTRVPAGDPTITVTPGTEAQAVYAVLPDGRKLDLAMAGENLWKVSFMVPFGTPDGPYDIKVFIVDSAERVRQANYRITIDNSLPLMKIKELAQADGSYRIEIKALFDARSIAFITASEGRQFDFKREKGIWTAVVPAMPGMISAVDVSGYVVEQKLVLAAVVKKTEKPVSATPAKVLKSTDTLQVLSSIPADTESNAGSNFSPFITALAVLALFALIGYRVKRN